MKIYIMVNNAIQREAKVKQKKTQILLNTVEVKIQLKIINKTLSFGSRSEEIRTRWSIGERNQWAKNRKIEE